MTDTTTQAPTPIATTEAQPANIVPFEQPPQTAAAVPARTRKLRTASSSIANIASAIAAITAEVGVVRKDGVNKFHGYKYVKMEDVLQQLTPLLAKHGLVIVQTEVDVKIQDVILAVAYEFTIAHSSGEVWPDRPRKTGTSRQRDSKGNTDDKCFNKCATAARKYFLLELFQIATDDDADAGDNDGPQRSRPAPNVAPHDPRPEPPHDPVTGEIIDAAPAAPAPSTSAPGAAGLSLEAMANEAAQRGDDIFDMFYLGQPEDKRWKLWDSMSVVQKARIHARHSRDKLANYYRNLSNENQKLVMGVIEDLKALYPKEPA